MTIADLAGAAGVSKSTASLAFSAPQRVRPETLARILSTAEAIGYAPNLLAQSLKTGRNNLLGLVVSDMTNPLNGAFLSAVQGYALAAGHLVLATTSHDDPDREAEILTRFRALRIRGAILAATGSGSDYARRLVSLGARIVMFDQKIDGLSGDHVGLDNRAATKMLTSHLLDLGHTRIGHVTGRRGLWTAEERICGIRDALAERGHTLDPTLVADADYRETASHAAAIRILDRADRPTAIVAANNLATVGALTAIRDLGLRCPADVSLVSVDGLPWPDLTDPPITAAVQPIAEIAKLATTWLFDRLDGSKPPPPSRERQFEATFYCGRSTAPLA